MSKSYVGPTIHMQKEGKANNRWCTIGNFENSCTQRNYNRVMKKWLLAELGEFEEKVEGCVNEYRSFVDNGFNRKQPRS